jgi:hypothetical protein
MGLYQGVTALLTLLRIRLRARQAELSITQPQLRAAD